MDRIVARYPQRFHTANRWGQSVNNSGECGDRAYNKYIKTAPSNVTDCNYENYAAGCVAVAMAQIMKYWEHPVHSTYQDYAWCIMTNGITDITTMDSINVATLIKDCGEKAMDYCSYKGTWPFGENTCSSSSTLQKAKKALKDFGYDDDDIDYKTRWGHSHKQWVNILKDELDNGRPVLYGGPGHAFVCDGYD